MKTGEMKPHKLYRKVGQELRDVDAIDIALAHPKCISCKFYVSVDDYRGNCEFFNILASDWMYCCYHTGVKRGQV